MYNVTKSVLLASTLLVATLSVQAQTQSGQPTPRPGIRLSAGANVITPTGGLRNTYNTGYGAFAQVAVPVASDKLFVTASTGLNRIFARENAENQAIASDLTLIPVKLGVQYFPIGRLYVQAEVGASFMTRKSGFTGAKTALTVAPQVGYLIPVGRHGSIDAGVRWENVSRLSNEVGNSRFLGFKLGYAHTL